MAALTRTAFSTLDPEFRPEATMLFNLARLYGSTIGIAVVQIFFYDNTQAMHLALAKHLTPDHLAGYVLKRLARLDTDRAAVAEAKAPTASRGRGRPPRAAAARLTDLETAERVLTRVSKTPPARRTTSAAAD
jgi:hypothetical protein